MRLAKTAALLALGAMLIPGTSSLVKTPGRMVTVTISRVHAIDNLDKDMDIKGPDRADFYAKIWINGQVMKTKVVNGDDIRPMWSYSQPVTGNIVRIRIKVNDEDGNIEGRDDWVDVNPRTNVKDLNFMYNVRTGRISGDVRGRRGQTIHSSGMMGDSSRGEIWFTVK